MTPFFTPVFHAEKWCRHDLASRRCSDQKRARGKQLMNKGPVFGFVLLLLLTGCADKFRNEKELLQNAADGNLPAVQRLIDTGVDINFKSKSGDQLTALQWAIYERQYPIAEFLLSKGADPTIKNLQGENAIVMLEKQEDSKEARTLLKQIKEGHYSSRKAN
jgi:hypothetical protein